MQHLTIRHAESVVQTGLRAVQGEPLDTPSGKLVPVAPVAYGVPLGAYEVTASGTRFVPNTTVLAFVLRARQRK